MNHLAPTLAQATPQTAEAATPNAPLGAPGINTGGAIQSALDKVDNLFNTTLSVFSYPDALAQSKNLTGSLANLSNLWAFILAGLGVACLVTGAKHYRVATLIVMTGIGATLGFWLGLQIEAPKIVLAVAVGTLLAAVAFPLMQYAVALLGGLTGAFVGANLWSAIASVINPKPMTAEQTADAIAKAQAAGTEFIAPANLLPPDMVWLGALIGLVAFGLFAFIVFNLSVVVFTSVGGATMAVLGILALLLGIDGPDGQIAQGLESHALVIPLLVLVPAVLGLIYQEQMHFRAKSGGEAKPA